MFHPRSCFAKIALSLKWLACAHLLHIVIVQTTSDSVAPGSTLTRFKQLSACRVQIGATKDDVINLEPLARNDGFPRFFTIHEYYNHPWNYTFNPCGDYSVPRDNPHTSGFGDGCHSVSICKYTLQLKQNSYFFTLGIHKSAKFQIRVDETNNQTVELVYKAIKSMRARSTIIKLVCDEDRTGLEDGMFVITSDSGRGPVRAELHHQCCCVGGCWKAGLGANDLGSAEDHENDDDENDDAVAKTANSQGSSSSKNNKKDDEGMLLIIVGCVVAIVMMVALIGGLCYAKRTQVQIYSKLPGKPNTPGQGISPAAKRDFRDYEPAGLAHKKLLPVLEDTMIHLDSLEMCQRLGGGIFGDTHLGKWNEMTVAVKRLTLLVHENQITAEAMKLMKNEVWFLSRQRHKNIVTILGLCLDGKLPSIITEYVVGECLKDFLRSQGRLLSWPHRVRIGVQIADGMAFLHSTKPPIIHRDLRCGNIFLLDNDVIKVADFGLIKMLQPIREECPQDDCCCRRTMCACPASIRWTAPELLARPNTRERLLPPAPGKAEAGSDEAAVKNGNAEAPSIITTACDVYSFAMVMWEIPMCHDPFEEIATEAEVLKIVKNGGRPETPPSADVMPQYKELMKFCWDQEPTHRPTFKQIATRLKDLGHQARAYQKQLLSRQRMQKLQENYVDF